MAAERCSGLIRALSQVKPKASQPEIYDTDDVLFSHPLDALRYLLVNLPGQVDEDWDVARPTRWTLVGDVNKIW